MLQISDFNLTGVRRPCFPDPMYLSGDGRTGPRETSGVPGAAVGSEYSDSKGLEAKRPLIRRNLSEITRPENKVINFVSFTPEKQRYFKKINYQV